MFSFPEVHEHAKCEIRFHRTLRIPDDGKDYPLPAGLGEFPMAHVDDFKDTVPDKWTGRGGVMLPMWQSEAMWLQFVHMHVPGHGHASWPCAIKVAAGKVSAITGKKWKDGLRKKDYCVAPGQKWLDGFVVEDGKIKQFVAAPLGSGASAEEQITGKAEFGGIQIEVFPMKLEAFERRFPKGVGGGGILRSHGGGGGGIGPFNSYAPPGVYTQTLTNKETSGDVNYSAASINTISETSDGPPKKGVEVWSGRPGIPQPKSTKKSLGSRSRGRQRRTTHDARANPMKGRQGFRGETPKPEKQAVQDMAMGAGGKMVQQVFEDPFDIEDWDTGNSVRCFVHLCSSTAWRQVTGAEPPSVPLTPTEYAAGNVPWFSLWESETKALKGTPKLAGLKTVKQVGIEKGIPLVTEDVSVVPTPVVALSEDAVKDGTW